jgi:hypothetical protein
MVNRETIIFRTIHIELERIEILEQQSQRAQPIISEFIRRRDPYNFLLPRVHLILLFNSLHPFRFCYLGAALVLRERNFFAAAFQCITTTRVCALDDEMRTQ